MAVQLVSTPVVDGQPGLQACPQGVADLPNGRIVFGWSGDSRYGSRRHTSNIGMPFYFLDRLLWLQHLQHLDLVRRD
jgi:hypothetical protein